MNFGNAWLMQVVKVSVVSSMLFLTACSAHPAKQVNDMLDRQTSSEYKAYEIKIGTCLNATHREIDSVEDIYFNSLSDEQKLKVLSILSRMAMDKCYSYEQAKYYEYAIINNDEEAFEIIKRLAYKPVETQENKALLDSIDMNEVRRLSDSNLFSTPFDALYIRDTMKIGL
ncbi:hypothetical protein GNP84_18925 [Aliivibrio fischeri]|uniref:hypothetical protein n=1 Tax=Aliivibrio fischeri TaxID=668 RepID=UPI0012D8DACB|nr:hypothetical protein [Aliivibrio fischeri]MUK78957.1 hypothetical protein [Aliivibrio fischeri]